MFLKTPYKVCNITNLIIAQKNKNKIIITPPNHLTFDVLFSATAKLIVVTFKRRRRANTVIPANTAMPMFLDNCDRNAHMAERELLCERAATLRGDLTIYYRN